jgi:Zn2+/Cd2+-exporting ATPase
MPQVPQTRYAVHGLHCAACARSVEKGVGQVPGVADCEVEFTSGHLEVRGDASAEAVLERVRELGYDARPLTGAGGRGGPDAGTATDEVPSSVLRFMLERREVRPALLGGILLVPGLLFHEILGWEALWIEVPALLALLLAGTPVVRSALRGLRINRELNIQALMSIAVVGALIIGAWVEAGMVVVLFSIGEALEAYAAARARGAIRGLMTVAPERATRIRRRPGGGRAAHGGDPAASAWEAEEREEEVPVEHLHPGDVILIRPGERIPMDGEVVAGHSAVDQSALTGESIPLEKEPGTEVLAGSVNGEGVLEVEVTRPASETTLHRMIRLVAEAQSRRAPVQRFIDRFARVYTPAVVGLAVFVVVIPPVVFGAPFWNPDPETFGWFYRGLALLVVACPCALVISVPASVVSALSNAARSGVLIKGGAYMEALARVRVVAFDKTGTLTEGALTVVGVRAVDCADPDEPSPDACAPCDDLLALAAAVEQRSEHPVGRAVARAARDRLPPERIPRATGHRALRGRGITAHLTEGVVTIGSHKHFDLHVPHDGGHCRTAEEAAREGRIPVLVEMDGKFLGTITLSDIPRASARGAVESLDRMGISTVLLSGDSPGAARHLAEEVGIRRTRAELLPEEKVAALRELRSEMGPVAMVGDGINDAPALAAADVGVAVGGDLGGTDQAREAAAVTLMRSDLQVLPRTLRLARATMQTVRANVAFAIGIKLAFLLLVLAGVGTLWMAVVADVGATLAVTLYGMRLLRWEAPGDRVPVARSPATP